MILWLPLTLFVLAEGNKKGVKCNSGQWKKGNECKERNYRSLDGGRPGQSLRPINDWHLIISDKDLVGFALEHQNLPQEAVDFAATFFEELWPKKGVWKISNKIRDLLRNSIAVES